jgi:hypothetical protein
MQPLHTDRPMTEIAHATATTGLKQSLIDLVDPMEERKSVTSDGGGQRFTLGNEDNDV